MVRMFRPSPFGQAALGTFGIACLIYAVWADGPMLAKVCSWMMAVVTPAALVVVLRTWVRIGDGFVEIGRVQGRVVFRAGQATVRELAVPSGLGRTGSALQIRATNGDSVCVALTHFRRRDRDALALEVRSTLKPRGKGGVPIPD